jgi:hypothetical protein
MAIFNVCPVQSWFVVSAARAHVNTKEVDFQRNWGGNRKKKIEERYKEVKIRIEERTRKGKS